MKVLKSICQSARSLLLKEIESLIEQSILLDRRINDLYDELDLTPIHFSQEAFREGIEFTIARNKRKKAAVIERAQKLSSVLPFAA